MKDAALDKDPQSIIWGNTKVSGFGGATPKSVDFKGQHQSQWILMKDAALDKGQYQRLWNRLIF